MASILRSGNLVVISSGYLVTAFEIGFPGSLVYEIETHNMQVDIKFIQKLSYKAEPLCLTLDSLSIIWSVIPIDGNTVEVECHGIRTTVGDDIKLTLNRINARREFLSESLAVPPLISQLFKKKFNNQGTDREIPGEGSGSPSKNGPPSKKVKQSCDKEDMT